MNELIMKLLYFPEGSRRTPEHHLEVLLPLGLPKGSPGTPLMYFYFDFLELPPESSQGLPGRPIELRKILDPSNPWGSPGRLGIQFCNDILSSDAPRVPMGPLGSQGVPKGPLGVPLVCREQNYKNHFSCFYFYFPLDSSDFCAPGLPGPQGGAGTSSTTSCTTTCPAHCRCCFYCCRCCCCCRCCYLFSFRYVHVHVYVCMYDMCASSYVSSPSLSSSKPSLQLSSSQSSRFSRACDRALLSISLASSSSRSISSFSFPSASASAYVRVTFGVWRKAINAVAEEQKETDEDDFAFATQDFANAQQVLARVITDCITTAVTAFPFFISQPALLPASSHARTCMCSWLFVSLRLRRFTCVSACTYCARMVVRPRVRLHLHSRLVSSSPVRLFQSQLAHSRPRSLLSQPRLPRSLASQYPHFQSSSCSSSSTDLILCFSSTTWEQGSANYVRMYVTYVVPNDNDNLNACVRGAVMFKTSQPTWAPTGRGPARGRRGICDAGHVILKVLGERGRTLSGPRLGHCQMACAEGGTLGPTWGFKFSFKTVVTQWTLSPQRSHRN